MTPIERILAAGQSHRSGDEAMPKEQEIREVEAALQFRFPDSYREFVRLGGLGELRIKHRVLRPSKILESCHYLADQEHVPFADNGCGDLYCWPRTDSPEPVVVFADHEAGNYTQNAESFTQWLEQNRF